MGLLNGLLLQSIRIYPIICHNFGINKNVFFIVSNNILFSKLAREDPVYRISVLLSDFRGTRLHTMARLPFTRRNFPVIFWK